MWCANADKNTFPNLRGDSMNTHDASLKSKSQGFFAFYFSFSLIEKWNYFNGSHSFCELLIVYDA